jgi:peptide/nickel transport system substrate-binding protein
MRIFLAIISILAISSCGSKDNSRESKMIFKYNESAGIHSFDPAYAKDQSSIWFCNQVYNSLVQLDSNLSIQASIAKNWEISENALVYTFTIDTSISFHQNDFFESRTIDVKDVVYSLERLQTPSTASPGAWVMANISDNGIQVINGNTVQIQLKKPNPAFLGLLSMQYCSVLPKEAEGIPEFFEKPVGTGPFHFQYHKRNVKLVLRKNERYFERDSKGESLPYLDAVSISFIPDKQTAFLEFIKGDLDFLSGIDASYKDELLTKTGELNNKYKGKIQFSKQDYLNTEYLGFLLDENQTNEALKSPKVRQALNIAFDKKSMMKYLRNGIGTPADGGIIPRGLSGNLRESTYSYNPDKALKLLEEAGYPNAEGIPEIQINTTSSYVDLCEYIQHAWKEIGIQVSIEVSPPSTHRQQVAQTQLSIFRASWIADYPDAENYLSLFYSANHCPNGPNYTHFSNAQFDALYEQSMNSTDLDYRARLYQLMDSIIMSEGAIIPLYYDNVLRFTKNGISGLGSNGLNLLDLKRVELMTND